MPRLVAAENCQLGRNLRIRSRFWNKHHDRSRHRIVIVTIDHSAGYDCSVMPQCYLQLIGSARYLELTKERISRAKGCRCND